MLRARNITLYKVMSAGYMTAELYSALKQHVFLSKITIDVCECYPHNIAYELNSFLKDDEIQERLYFLEKLESKESKESSYLLLDNLLESEESKVGTIIDHIGKNVFLCEYAFASYSSLGKRYYVNSGNILSIIKFLKRYERAFKEWCIKEFPEDFAKNDTEKGTKSRLDKSSIHFGIGFQGKDIIEIDKDAVSSASLEKEKYVLYLYNLNNDEIKVFNDYLRDKLSFSRRCTIKVFSVIGSRNYLINYLFADESKLLKIRNIGKKVCNDLIGVRKELQCFVQDMYEKDNTEEIEEMLRMRNLRKHGSLRQILGEEKYSLLLSTLHRQCKALSVRAQNVLKNYKGDFIEDFVHKGGKITDLPKAGRAVKEELSPVVEMLKKEVQDLIRKELTSDDLCILSKKVLYGELLDEYSENYMREHGHLPMLHILENLLKEKLNCRNMRILHLCYPLFNDESTYTRSEVANKEDMTQERVRQICEEQSNEFFSFAETVSHEELDFRKITSQKNDWKYIFEFTNDKLIIKEEEINKFVKSERCRLSKNILFATFYSLLHEDFCLVGRALFSSKKSMWKKTYLIRKDMCDCFDFDKLLSWVKGYEMTSSETLIIDIDNMILTTFNIAWKEFRIDMVETISRVVVTMFINELELIPNEQNCFIIEGKREMDTVDIIYTILEKRGNPMSISEIYDVDKKLQERYKTSSTLRSLVHKDIRLCMIARSNKVGLTHWQHIKKEGIRDIIVRYLEKFNEPQLEQDIIKHVQLYKQTSDKSIRSTMYSGKQFVKFHNQLWGLKNKKYSIESVKKEQKKSFKLRIIELEQFLQEKKRFPINGLGNDEENKLYVWWNRIKKKTILKHEEGIEIRKILNKYKDLPSSKKEIEWLNNYYLYQSYVITNKCKPQSNVEDERSLCLWFEKSMEELSNGSLNSIQQKQFVELCKMI